MEFSRNSPYTLNRNVPGINKRQEPEWQLLPTEPAGRAGGERRKPSTPWAGRRPGLLGSWTGGARDFFGFVFATKNTSRNKNVNIQ